MFILLLVLCSALLTQAQDPLYVQVSAFDSQDPTCLVNSSIIWFLRSDFCYPNVFLNNELISGHVVECSTDGSRLTITEYQDDTCQGIPNRITSLDANCSQNSERADEFLELDTCNSTVVQPPGENVRTEIFNSNDCTGAPNQVVFVRTNMCVTQGNQSFIMSCTDDMLPQRSLYRDMFCQDLFLNNSPFSEDCDQGQIFTCVDDAAVWLRPMFVLVVLLSLFSL